MLVRSCGKVAEDAIYYTFKPRNQEAIDPKAARQALSEADVTDEDVEIQKSSNNAK